MKLKTYFGSLLLAGLSSLYLSAAPPAGAIKVTGPTLAWWCYNSDFGVGPFDTAETIAMAKKYNASIDLPPASLIPQIQESGVKVACLGMSLEGKPPFILSPGNPKEAEEILTAMRTAIDTANKYEIPMVLCFTGNKVPELSIKQQFDNLVAAYKEMAAYAKSKNVQLVLECLNDNRFVGSKGPMKGHPGYLGNDPWLCLDLVKAVGEPEWFGLATDWYHLGTEDYDFGIGNSQDLEVYIEAAKTYILHTHVAGVYDNKVLTRGPLHVAGQKLDYTRIYKTFGTKISYCLENPIYGGGEDKAAAEAAIAEAIKIVEE